MTDQFIDCIFAPGGRRYCYRHAGPPFVSVGDIVEVPTARGAERVTVVAIWDRAPGFDTKQIIRIVPEGDRTA